jgi:hypothetical protein
VPSTAYKIRSGGTRNEGQRPNRAGAETHAITLVRQGRGYVEIIRISDGQVVAYYDADEI